MRQHEQKSTNMSVVYRNALDSRVADDCYTRPRQFPTFLMTLNSHIMLVQAGKQ